MIPHFVAQSLGVYASLSIVHDQYSVTTGPQALSDFIALEYLSLSTILTSHTTAHRFCLSLVQKRNQSTGLHFF